MTPRDLVYVYKNKAALLRLSWTGRTILDVAWWRPLSLQYNHIHAREIEQIIDNKKKINVLVQIIHLRDK